MTRTFKRIIATGIIFILIAAGAVMLVMTGGCSSGVNSSLDDVKNNAVNTAIDVSGIKGRIDSELRAHAGELAAEYGISQSVADSMIDSLAVEDWRATTLPADAKPTSTSTLNLSNVETTLTTYEDPSIVTLDAYGMSVTLEAPESAQAYTPFLQYLQYVQ